MQPSHAELQNDLHFVQETVSTVEEKLDQIIASQASFAEQLKDVKKTADATKDVVEAWDTARNLARFIKWVSGLIAALVAIAAAIKMHSLDLIA